MERKPTSPGRVCLGLLAFIFLSDVKRRNTMFKLLFEFIIELILLTSAFTSYAEAFEASVKATVYSTIPYEHSVDYRRLMYECAVRGEEYDLAMGSIYETQRNVKLMSLGRELEMTNYFSPLKTSLEIMTDMIVDDMRKEYDVAAEVYGFLSKRGYSDVIIAAILGNMMNEVGGNTLELKPCIYDSSYGFYGLCQWNLVYNSSVAGSNITEQLHYLLDTIEKEMNLFGGSYNAFIELDAVEYAGVYFGKYYERGINLKQRGINSIRAYEWIKRFKP